MSQLLILCPNTRRLLPTNRSIRATALAGADLGVNTIGPCPHCGQHHTWTIADAYLPGMLAADAGGLPPRVIPVAKAVAQELPADRS